MVGECVPGDRRRKGSVNEEQQPWNRDAAQGHSQEALRKNLCPYLTCGVS